MPVVRTKCRRKRDKLEMRSKLLIDLDTKEVRRE
jgi:hypothetical protein